MSFTIGTSYGMKSVVVSNYCYLLYYERDTSCWFRIVIGLQFSVFYIGL